MLQLGIILFRAITQALCLLYLIQQVLLRAADPQSPQLAAQDGIRHENGSHCSWLRSQSAVCVPFPANA